MSRLFAAIYDPFMRRSEEACLHAWRAELLGALEGRVLEIGAGTGANVPFYPRTLERLVLSDPDPHMLARLRRVRDACSDAAEVVVATADRLPFPDGAFDVVVSTLVLCSVPDVSATLAEIRRVLVRGGSGRLVFLEHVAADRATHPGRRRWQGAIEPLWSRIAGNCHLTRDTARAIQDAGFERPSITRESMRRALPLVRPTVRGVAFAP